MEGELPRADPGNALGKAMIVGIGGFPSDLGNRLASATNTFSGSQAS